MFEEIAVEIEMILDFPISDEVLEELGDDVEGNIRSFLHEREEIGEPVTVAAIEEHFSDQLDKLWSMKYASKDLHYVIEDTADEVGVEIDPYTANYLNRLKTSVAANLLYASAIVAKWEGDEAVEIEIVDDLCHDVFNKTLRC